jgi:hypothetical protein
MRSKLLNVLTVGLVTLAMISPGLAVFGMVWGKHIELVKIQNLSCGINKIALDSHPANFSSKKLPDHSFLQQLQIVSEEYKITTILQWFVLGTPICIGLGVIAYDRYLVYRAAVLKRQIQMLERLWQQSIEQ